MEKQKKLNRSVMIVALLTALILMVPLVAMQFSEEVKWGFFDFIIMGALIFSIGMSYVLLTRSAPNLVYKIAMAMGLGTMFLMIWANLAVGLIGSGANPANLLYAGVVIVGIVAILRSNFRAQGMERAMYATAIALVLHAGIALFIGIKSYPGAAVTEILGVDGFFAGLFLIAGSLFRIAGKEGVVKQA